MKIQKGGAQNALVFVVCAMLSSLAMAGTGGGPEGAATDIIDTVVSILQAVGVGLFTIAIMWAGYRIAFQGARFADVANVVIGGILVGGAAVFAAWLMGG